MFLIYIFFLDFGGEETYITSYLWFRLCSAWLSNFYTNKKKPFSKIKISPNGKKNTGTVQYSTFYCIGELAKTVKLSLQF